MLQPVEPNVSPTIRASTSNGSALHNSFVPLKRTKKKGREKPIKTRTAARLKKEKRTAAKN